MKSIFIALTFTILGITIQAQSHFEVDGTAKVGLPGEGNVLLTLNSERSWVFKQLGTGASTALELTAANPNNNNKSFVINTKGRIRITHMDTITETAMDVVRLIDGSLAVKKNKYNIGDMAHGGIVFYVNAEGTHGLVAANQDQTVPVFWYAAVSYINRPSGHDSVGRAYFDWRLPYDWELFEMWKNLHRNECTLDGSFCATSLGNFTSDTYWSATETEQAGWYVNFNDGDQDFQGKTDATYRTRAVRAF